MPVSIDHGIIGLMDPAHGPFVHQAWWWRSQHSIHEKKKNFEPIPNGFRMSAHTPSSNSAPYKLLRLYADADSITTTIDFVLPNLRTETIRAGKYWFSSLTTVTPITRNHCRIDVVAAWNLFRWVPFVPDILKFVFAKFVEQDRRTMELQAEGLQTQSAPDADRRRRPSRQMVFPAKSRAPRSQAHRHRNEASDAGPRHIEMEKLRRFCGRERSESPQPKFRALLRGISIIITLIGVSEGPPACDPATATLLRSPASPSLPRAS